MTTPVWQPGTLYPPGSLVRPVSSSPQAQSPPDNGDFEDGDYGWTLASGFSIVQDGVSFDGTWALKFDQTAEQRAINHNNVDIVPGQSITASCQVQAGSSCGARVELAWYDGYGTLISYSAGNEIQNAGSTWMQSTVTAVAPAGAETVKFVVTAFRVSGTRTPHIDQCVWNAVPASFTTGLVFKAVQALAGSSGITEPVWPLVNGQTVVDNEVTWEAVFASRVVWEASPVLVSGSYEPNWPTVADGTVADGTIKWVAMNFRIPDAKCPNSKVVAIAASKVFAADNDIIAFCATVNPLDWSAENDAGYIPFGLNTFGSTPVTAMGLYRSNLVAFNSEGYQMWQVDQDPANMAILDGSPVACLFPKSVQPVSNDLVMCTPEGVRNIGIAGASTNLQAGYFGAQIDPLVLAKIRNDEIPFALFWPAMGQYWLIFGDEAFVLTMNGGAKDQSWSRYVFPAELTDWAILEGNLYLRAVDLVWLVNPETLVDDAGTPLTGGIVTFMSGDIQAPNVLGLATFADPSFGYGTGGTLVSGTLAGYDSLIIRANNVDGFQLQIVLRVPTVDLRDDPQTAYWEAVTITGDPTYPEVLSSTAGFSDFVDGEFTILYWNTISIDPFIDGNEYVATFTPIGTGGDNVPFEGYIAWPYLDFGLLGVDKMLEGFDIVADGTFAVSFGYTQRDFSLATDPYTIDGDTLPGGMVPMPLTGPSFQYRLTFAPSQQWEWFASNLYINNLGTG